MHRTDAELREAVSLELEWDRRVEEAEIAVTVNDGVVLLGGAVRSWALRITAQEAAQRVAFVRDVINELEVKGEQVGLASDAELAHAVQNALDWDQFVPSQSIRSSVVNRHVTLEGSVEHFCQREDAERAVRNLKGVIRVYNKIQLQCRSALPHEIQRSIEAALERRSGQSARRVNLDVHEGKVILTGLVQSWAERQLVLSAVKGTAGVRSVDDRLRTLR